MTISAVSLNCPACGAGLEAEEGRQYTYCAYCGSKIAIVNASEQSRATVDEAEVKKAEAEVKKAEAEAKKAAAEYQARVKELELEKQRAASKKKAVSWWLCVTLVFLGLALLIVPRLLGMAFTVGIIGAVLAFVVIPRWTEESQLLENGGIRLPRDLRTDVSGGYESAYAILRGAGFTNVTCVNLHDVVLGLFEKNGRIEKITVDGEPLSTARRVYLPNVPIVITYHGR